MADGKHTILVVDDDAMTRDLVTTVLSVEGHKCVAARDGVEAMEKVGSGHFDAVITDIVMPKMDGITLTKKLSQNHPGLPIMVMTGFSEYHSDEDALGAGARDFINKPFSVAEFSARFHRMMSDHKILDQIKSRQKDIERIGGEIISGIEKESADKIETLTKEIEGLKKRMKPA